jgi:prephenate dehydratase
VKVAYQGAPGAYSESAAATLFPDAERVAERTFADVFAVLSAQGVRAAVVPVENTLAGSVVDVYDLLRTHDDLTVIGEVAIPIRHCLLVVPGTRIEEVRVARSHAHALAQVADYLRSKNIEPAVAFDTAGAASEVALAGDRSVAAVAARGAAATYGLEVAAEIPSATDNYTRFFAITRRGDHGVADALAPALGVQKTSIVYATKNVPGALVRTLQPFATAGIQMTKIESRPSRNAPWQYVFYLDFEGHPAASPAREALALMATCCEWVHVLGTYRSTSTTAAEIVT